MNSMTLKASIHEPARIEKKEACSMRALFEPKKIAVIGASRRPEAVGYAILKNLMTGDFKGEIFPVNPQAAEIEGLRSYHQIEDLPDGIDMAVIIVPSVQVPATLKLCGEKKMKAAIVISAGFREIGGEGMALEKEVISLGKQLKMPVLGPNCLGLINTDPRFSVNASFSRTMPREGGIAFISQSGALCAAILDYAKGKGIGFSKFVSLGNKALINELDMLRYLKDDPDTDVILMYVEDLVDGRAFIEMAREITGEQKHAKPILAIKSGRTAQGAKAASSHTGSLVGSDEVYDAIFAQAGVLRLDSVEEMFQLAVGFANQPLPEGNRVAVVTNAGGPGIMATDACIRSGLEMAKLSDQSVDALKKVLPPTSNFSNPIDVIGDARHGRYEDALRIVSSDPGVDALIVILTPQAMTEIEEVARVVVDLDRKTEKTVLACFMGIVDVSPGVKILEENHVPHYTFPEDAARALGAMRRYQDWTLRPRTEFKKFQADTGAVKSILEKASGRVSKVLNAFDSMRVLKAYGFPVLPFAISSSKQDAVLKAKEIGFPVAMKIVSPQIIHKFDVGGVRLRIQNEPEVEAVYQEMMRKTAERRSERVEVEGVFIQAMSRPGREVILGMNRDAHFGPILMFGLGGIYVEALKDVTFRLAPIREFGARRMIQSIRAYPLLKGLRGEKPSDFEAIMDSLERLSQLACDHPEIQEIDMNPLIVHSQGEGASVVDARIIVA
jgi:acetate---CoA ligase (ADP-forming)